MRLRHVLQDLGRSVRGMVTIVAYLTVRQDLDVAIGLLAAESGVATKGQRNPYVVRIVNTRSTPRLLLLSIELRAADVLGGSHSSAAHFSNSFTVPPRTSTTIAFQYDWAGEARFHHDGVSYAPEHGRQEGLLGPQCYAVTAILSEAGKLLDTLTIYQALAA